jgi:hypothetical protein
MAAAGGSWKNGNFVPMAVSRQPLTRRFTLKNPNGNPMSEKQKPIVESVLRQRINQAMADARQFRKEYDALPQRRSYDKYRFELRSAARWRRLLRASSQFTTRHASVIISDARLAGIGGVERQIFGKNYGY